MSLQKANNFDGEQVKNLESLCEGIGPIRVGLKFMTVSFNLPRGTFVGVTV